MKTTCLIPVKVEDWMQRNPSSGWYPIYDPNDLKPELGFKTARYDSYNNSWHYDTSCIHPEFVYEPQSGYFFTEEEMESFMRQLSGVPITRELTESEKKIFAEAIKNRQGMY